MLFVGWGKKGKEIAYAGIEKCPHCRNWTHFAIFETTKRVTLYFVPVASWDRKAYLVCGTCETAWELEPSAVSKTLADSARLPPREQAEAIWRDLDAELLAAAEAHPGDTDAVYRLTMDRLYAKHPRQWADYVAGRRFAAFADTNPPG